MKIFFSCKLISKHCRNLSKVACDQCGGCVLSCPTSAIVGNLPQRRVENKKLILDEDSVLPSEKELLLYVASGVQTLIYNGEEMNSTLSRIVHKVNTSLLKLGLLPFELVLAKNAEQRATRREWFHSVKAKGRDLAKDLTPASWRIKSEGWKLSSYYPNHAFFEVTLNRRDCSLCHACFNLCSEQVFTLLESELEINHQKCVGCLLCVDICLDSAIQVRPFIDNEVFTVSPVRKKRCSACGNSYVSFNDVVSGQTNEMCHICTSTHQNENWLSAFK